MMLMFIILLCLTNQILTYMHEKRKFAKNIFALFSDIVFLTIFCSFSLYPAYSRKPRETDTPFPTHHIISRILRVRWRNSTSRFFFWEWLIINFSILHSVDAEELREMVMMMMIIALYYISPFTFSNRCKNMGWAMPE